MNSNFYQIPEWINNTFLERALQDFYVDKSVFLKSFEVVSIAADRERNYWCDTLRLTLNFTNSQNPLKSKNVIVKIENSNPHMDAGLANFSPFRRELLFYRDILPKIEGLLVVSQKQNDNSSASSSDEICSKLVTSLNERPSPKCLIIEEPPYRRKVSRQLGLDLPHLKLAIAKLAKFHAASARLYEVNEELFDQHQQPNITTNFRFFHSLFETCLTTIIDELQLDDGEKLRGKLENFKHFMIDRVSDAVTLQNEEFAVLCHGDLWMDNLLYQYEEDGKPINVRMNELGLSFIGSPAIDLTYLIFSSSSADICDIEIDMLLQHYQAHLHENLIKLNYPLPIPSLIHVHNRFLKCGVVGFMYACLLLPMRFRRVPAGLIDDEADAAVGEEEPRVSQHPELKKRIEFLVKYCERKGIFD